mgnify:CR=1 FL=1
MKANLSQNGTSYQDEVQPTQNISEQVHYTFWLKSASIYIYKLFIYVQ